MQTFVGEPFGAKKRPGHKGGSDPEPKISPALLLPTRARGSRTAGCRYEPPV